MTNSSISASDPYERLRIRVLDSEMAYVDVGQGEMSQEEMDAYRRPLPNL